MLNFIKLIGIDNGINFIKAEAIISIEPHPFPQDTGVKTKVWFEIGKDCECIEMKESTEKVMEIIRNYYEKKKDNNGIKP